MLFLNWGKNHGELGGQLKNGCMGLKTLPLTYVTWFHCSIQMFRTNIFTFCWRFKKPCLLTPHHRLPWRTLNCVYLHIFKNGNLFFFFKFIILLTLRYRFPNLRSFSFITIDIINFFCQICLLRDNQQKKHFIKWTPQSTPLYLLPKPLAFDNIYQYRVTLDTLFTMKFSSYSLKRMYFPPTIN